MNNIIINTMSTLVILNLGQGSLQQGFPSIIARLCLEKTSQEVQFSGELPPNSELGDLYKHWQLMYDLLYQARSFEFRRYRSSPDESDDLIIDEKDITHVSEAEFAEISQALEYSLNQWLNHQLFRPVERQLRSRLHPDDDIRLIIQTEDPQLRQIPWYGWLFLEDYPNAEISLSSLNFEVKTLKQNQSQQVKILAILGDKTGIDIEADRQLLSNLPNAEITFLVEPTRQVVSEQLWNEEGWDLLFFAGHSITHQSGETGQIYLNPQDSLTLSQLKHALREAITNGLQFAIFNSCDGLGLAKQLEKENIPYLIVMREPVADQVAQYFLKYFLKEFAKGKTFDLSVRKARERLQGIEGEFPCASWLPVIFQNPAYIPKTWQELCHQTDEKNVNINKNISQVKNLSLIQKIWQKRISLLKVSLFSTALVMGIRSLGLLQSFELQAFDQLLRLRRPYEKPDNRILIIKATPEDLQAQKVKPPNNASLSEHTLIQVFKKLQKYEPVVIGLDIYRDFPVDSNYPQLKQYLTQENLFAICKVRDPNSGDHYGVAPPPEILPSHLSFSDAVADKDGKIRRHLLSMKGSDPTDPCTAHNSLSFILALYYLDYLGYQWDYNNKGDLKLKSPHLNQSITIKPLSSFSGGYQQLDARGRQIFLNYRSLPPASEIAYVVTFDDLINDKIPPKIQSELKNRIIILGITGYLNTNADYWLTPYSESQPSDERKMAGLLIQGHMVSQIISRVLDLRPLIWVFPLWGEVLWVLIWSGIGGIIAYWLKDFKSIMIGIFVTSGILYIICYVFMIQGGWLPLIPTILALIVTVVILKIEK